MARVYELRPGKQQPGQQLKLQLDDFAMQAGHQLDRTIVPGGTVYTLQFDDPAGTDDTRLDIVKNLVKTLNLQESVLFDGHSINLVVANNPSTDFIRYGTSMLNNTGESDANKWSRYSTALGGVVGYRKYSGGAVSKWNTDPDLLQVLARPECKTIWQSFKGSGTNAVTGLADWTTADLTTWMGQANFPTDRLIILSWFHEPEDNWNTVAERTEYRSRLAAFGDWVKANCPSNVITAAPVFQSFTFNPGSGRNWQDWWPSGTHFDLVSCDRYNRPGQADTADQGYQNMADMLGGIESVWANVTTRLNKIAIGEYASPNVGDPKVTNYSGPLDPDGTRRAAWYQTSVNYYSANADKYHTVLQWDSVGDKGDFRLNIDTKCPPIWKAACQSTRAALGV